MLIATTKDPKLNYSATIDAINLNLEDMNKSTKKSHSKFANQKKLHLRDIAKGASKTA